MASLTIPLKTSTSLSFKLTLMNKDSFNQHLQSDAAGPRR
jgi:hypothetical protein